MFDALQYLLTVHRETDSHAFYEGIQHVKNKLKDKTQLNTKRDLVAKNYVQFLAAKMTLDDINRKFLVTSESQAFLADLEDAVKSLRVKAQLKLRPLVESLARINDCVATGAAVKQIAQLLKVNRQVQLALTEEDDVAKAVAVVQRERGALSRAQRLVQARSQGVYDDAKCEATAKIMLQMERTLRKAIEKVGQKILALSSAELLAQGLDTH